eukprot:528820_1
MLFNRPEKEIRQGKGQDLAHDSAKLRDAVLKGSLIGLLIGLVLVFAMFSGVFDDDNPETLTSAQIENARTKMCIFGFEGGDIVRISVKQPPRNRFDYKPDMIATVSKFDSYAKFYPEDNTKFDAIHSTLPVDLWVVYSQPGKDAPRQMQKLKYRAAVDMSHPDRWKLNDLDYFGVRDEIDCTKYSAVVYAGSHVEVRNLDEAQGERILVRTRNQNRKRNTYIGNAIVDRYGTAVLIPDGNVEENMRNFELSTTLPGNPVVELTFLDRETTIPNSYRTGHEKCDINLDRTVRVTAILHENDVTAITVHGLQYHFLYSADVYLKFYSPGSRALMEGYKREYASDAILGKDLFDMLEKYYDGAEIKGVFGRQSVEDWRGEAIFLRNENPHAFDAVVDALKDSKKRELMTVSYHNGLDERKIDWFGRCADVKRKDRCAICSRMSTMLKAGSTIQDVLRNAAPPIFTQLAKDLGKPKRG